MDIAKIRHLADAIEHGTIPGMGFSMETYRVDALYGAELGYRDVTGRKDIDMVGCIAGNAVSLFGGDGTGRYALHTGAAMLGLGSSDAYRLLEPHEDPAAWKATPRQAARALRHLADTGKVDWEYALREPEVVG